MRVVRLFILAGAVVLIIGGACAYVVDGAGVIGARTWVVIGTGQVGAGETDELLVRRWKILHGLNGTGGTRIVGWDFGIMRLGSDYLVLVPGWSIALVGACVMGALAAGPRVMRSVVARRARRRGRCASCGYELRGAPETGGRVVCPECGAEAG